MGRVGCAIGLLVWGAALAACEDATPAADLRDFTCFQTASPYAPELDIGSDVAIVYGVNDSFEARIKGWRDAGYTASMMTGIAWGGYGDYYVLDDGKLKESEIQTDAAGKLFMHGNSTSVGYNVPTPSYVDYIKRNITPAIDNKVAHIFLEEPEFWARTGWSAGFQDAWKAYYGTSWEAPDSSVNAQYRASRLKYELYFNALNEVTSYIDKQAAARGTTIETVVPTHSLINYAQWRIVSPESHLMDIAGLDGYVAQVWTGTARSANVYRGEKKSRTFETAYLEYGQMLSMVKPTGRKVWFLADPVEDNPNRSWADYKYNYEATLIASLMWPEVHRFEVMPWPNRIFRGTYPKTDMTEQADSREGIPSEYATEILTAINALNDMNQPDVDYDTGTRGIGVVVSDTMMFQRANPTPSDDALSFFFGLAMPLVKAGVPVEMAQLENSLVPGAFDHLHTLLLTYEGQKPLRPDYHDALAAWVRKGGVLIYVGDGSDPYHAVKAWWNDDGATDRRPEQDLFERLGATMADAAAAPCAVGGGRVSVVPASPSELAAASEGATTIRDAVFTAMKAAGHELDTQHYLRIQRGPYVVVSVLDESVADEPVVVPGTMVNLLDPALPVVSEMAFKPGERSVLYDLAWLERHKVPAKVIAAAARIREESWDGHTLTFTARGPKGTHGRARARLPKAPSRVEIAPEREVASVWDESSRTVLLDFENTAESVKFLVRVDGE